MDPNPTDVVLAIDQGTTNSKAALVGADGTIAAIGSAGVAQPATTGCPFAPRCPLATDVCVTERPPLRLVDETSVACHHAERVPQLRVHVPVRHS